MLAHNFPLLDLTASLQRHMPGLGGVRDHLFRCSGPASQSTQTVEGATTRDGNQPGKNPPARGVKVPSPPPDLQKRLLKHVLRLLAVM